MISFPRFPIGFQQIGQFGQAPMFSHSFYMTIPSHNFYPVNNAYLISSNAERLSD
jgi:hypothetical protein